MNIFTKIKNIDSFTHTEQDLADFILSHPLDIIDCDIHELAKISYVSTSTIYRFIDKLELKGLSQLKMLVSSQYEDYIQEQDDTDYNYPFKEFDTHHTIIHKMNSLYHQTLTATKNLIDLKELMKVVQVLDEAQRILIFPGVGNIYSAGSFEQNMKEIGANVIIETYPYHQYLASIASHKNDAIIIISYANRATGMLDIMKEAKKTGAKVILISSTKYNPLFDYADYQLYFCSYENKEEKIASFSSKLSLQYLLDCLYACYFNRRYKENLNYRIHSYKEL